MVDKRPALVYPARGVSTAKRGGGGHGGSMRSATAGWSRPACRVAVRMRSASERIVRLVSRVRGALAKGGPGYLMRTAQHELVGAVAESYWYYQVIGARRTFWCQGQRYHYLCHRYNSTWKTERAVEIPLLLPYLDQRPGATVLEVGNVLAHYRPINHLVVDKYERAPGVLNEDIVDFWPNRRFDLIISISTLEHVGWDETPREPVKLLRAVAHLRRLLMPGGQLVVTLPVGYNAYLDQLLGADQLPFASRVCLQRISRDNCWREVEWSTIRSARLHHPFRGINGLILATFTATEAEPGGARPTSALAELGSGAGRSEATGGSRP